MLGLTRSSAFVIGPAVAGAVVAVANPGWVFAVDAATFAVSRSVARAAPHSPSGTRAVRESFVAELAGGWRELVSRTWLWVIIVLGDDDPPVRRRALPDARADRGQGVPWRRCCVEGIIAAALGLGMVAGGLIALRLRPARPMLACALAFFLAVPG